MPVKKAKHKKLTRHKRRFTMKHKTFFLIFTALFMLAVFWVAPNTYSQGCTITITFTSDGSQCSEPVSDGLEVHFWTDGFGADDFTAYTDVNGQIIHYYAYCSQTYFLEETSFDCLYGGCIKDFVPASNPGGFTMPYECAAPGNCVCNTNKPKGTSSDNEIPKQYFLHQNYPNPFNPVTNIKFDLPYDSYVTLTIYDISGKEVVTLIDGIYTAGIHNIDFDGSNLSSGVYVYKIETADYTSIRKMILVK